MCIIPSLSIELSVTCPLFKCADLPNLECVKFSKSSLTYYIQPCQTASSPYCPSAYNSNATCTFPPNPSPALLYPGESCNSSQTCISKNCKSTCQGLPKNSICYPYMTGNSECDPGLYCEVVSGTQGICLPLIAKGRYCGIDNQCEYGTYCFNSICTKLFTLKPGTEIPLNNCVNSTSFLCENAQCLGFENGTAACVQGVKSSFKVPKVCENDEDCTVLSHGNKVLGKCLCGSGLGVAYCQLFNGDGWVKKYLIMMEEWFESEEIKKCNIDAVLRSQCMSSHWGDWLKFRYYEYMARNYIAMYGAQSCTLKVFFSEYYEYKKGYKEDESFGELAGLALLFGIMLIF